MSAIASQITSLTIVYLIIHSGADQREHHSSVLLGFVQGIHRWPVNSPHKWPVTRKMFPFDDVIMCAWFVVIIISSCGFTGCINPYFSGLLHWNWGNLNTLRLRQDGRHFADNIFTCIFFNENCCILIKFSLKYVQNGPIDNNPALVQLMAWRRLGDKPLSEPMMVSLPTHICVTRPQWVKSQCQWGNPEEYEYLNPMNPQGTHYSNMKSPPRHLNSSPPGQNGCCFADDTFRSDAFSWMESSVFWLKFHWSLFLRVQLAITQYWFR